MLCIDQRDPVVLGEDGPALSHGNLNARGRCSIRASVLAGDGVRPLRDPVRVALGKDDGMSD
ncbi:hypothetical protein [Streptomyces albipurpureus]|uniref:Uncharacterized protein n=1 Tax=Streptomyces albipurpureus TaxID=2897419 RepID=A0ABT0UI13_9ACTN|nr:hypothetical protein [Streptomyces sp. CWNU-1]MCM2388272.1 hypothetical protein [Streptomyces sp. CWNU-1]